MRDSDNDPPGPLQQRCRGRPDRAGSADRTRCETLRPLRKVRWNRGLPFLRLGPRHIWALAGCASILYYLSMPDKKRTGRLDWEDVRYFVALARHRTLSAT